MKLPEEPKEPIPFEIALLASGFCIGVADRGTLDLAEYERELIRSAGWALKQALLQRKVAREALDALRMISAFWDDLAKSNPRLHGEAMLAGYYGQWNEALLKSEIVLARYAEIK